MGKVKGRKSFFAIKVDLNKAYDRLNWNFIWRILMEVQIPEEMSKVIMHSVTSKKTNVKWNGDRRKLFRPQRGIRQGDPISPYLFVMCIDKLSHLIGDAVAKGTWKALKVERNGPDASHLIFTDDLFLFGEATKNQMTSVTGILITFCEISEQQVSCDKTIILFSPKIDRRTRDKLTRMSGYKERNSLGRYLGISLTGKTPKKKDFDYVIDQLNAMLM